MAEICSPLPGAVSLLNAIRGQAKSVLLLMVLPRYNNSSGAHRAARVFRSAGDFRAGWRREARSENLNYALEQAGNPDRSRVLMVGDTAESDILGGINAGLSTCWLNAHHREQPAGIHPTWTVASLSELEQLLCKH